MALTSMGKRELDRKCNAIIGEIGVGSISRDGLLIDKLGGTYTMTSVLAAFKRIVGEDDWGEAIRYDSTSKIFYFSPVRKRINTGNRTVQKNKNILTFGCFNGLEWDFATKTFNMDTNEFSNFDRLFTPQAMKALKENEWLFNYSTDLMNILYILRDIPSRYTDKMPSGLYEYLKSANSPLDRNLFYKFIFLKEFGKYANFARNITNCDFGERYEYLEIFLEDYSFDTLMKMMKNTILTEGEIPSLNILVELIMNYARLKKNGFEVKLNTERSVYRNIQDLEDLRDREKNAMLERQLQRLNFINGKVLADGKFTIVVPQNQKEKQDEGWQQNNCVGYHYDNSIMRGENLIYFLRLTNNVKHSFVTCRYNISEQATVEARAVNNTSISNDIWFLLGELDKFIRVNLQ